MHPESTLDTSPPRKTSQYGFSFRSALPSTYPQETPQVDEGETTDGGRGGGGGGGGGEQALEKICICFFPPVFTEAGG